VSLVIRKVVDRVLAASALLFFVAYASPIVFPDLDAWLKAVCSATQVGVWVVFAADLLWRLARAPEKRGFMIRSWFDFVVLAVPMLRPLRLLRAVSMASLVARRMSAGRALRVSVAVRATVSSLLVWLIAALAVTEAERGSQGSIQTVVDGLWWGLSTMTTVGYGDAYPVTAEGRLIGGLLMLTGIAIFSVAAGTISSWFIERMNQTVDDIERDTQQIEALRGEVAQLRVLLEQMSRQPDISVVASREH